MPIDEENVHDVRVVASHWFGETLMSITENNVHFHAMLLSELGNTWPVIRLHNIECNICAPNV